MEADHRQAELVLQQLDLNDSKSLSSPGVDGKEQKDHEDKETLGPAKTTEYRGPNIKIEILKIM